MTKVNEVSHVEASASDSARAVLLTVLGEFVRPDGATAWTSALVNALGALGIEQAAARQALARSRSTGMLVTERIGRRTRWTLTAQGRHLLDEGAARIYSFGDDEPEWDGLWLLVLTTVPEHNRHLRNRLKSRLSWLGFAVLGPGTWVTPWVEREPQAAEALRQLGLTTGALSWIGQPGALGAVPERVAAIWRLDTVTREYQSFLQSTEAERPGSTEESFAALVRLVHSWRHFPAVDPGLPTSLLPGAWPRAAAAQLFRDRRSRWSPAAWEWWRQQAGD